MDNKVKYTIILPASKTVINLGHKVPEQGGAVAQRWHGDCAGAGCAGALLATARATVALHYLLLIEKLPISLASHFCGRSLPRFCTVIFVGTQIACDAKEKAIISRQLLFR